MTKAGFRYTKKGLGLENTDGEPGMIKVQNLSKSFGPKVAVNGVSFTVERAEVEGMEDSSLSLMPEGLLEALKPEQARDLIGYLMHQTQVPLPQ